LAERTPHSDHEADLKPNFEQRKRSARRTALLLLAVVLAVYFSYIVMYASGP
jgi:uncharacterized membrane protein (DUF485 family)